MNKDIQDLLTVARETLEDARALFEKQRYPGTVERTYFTILHAASAMLLHAGVKTGSHYGVKIKFAEAFVKGGTIERRFGRMLSDAYDLRLDAEYVPAARSGISREVAEEQLRMASDFLEMAENFLKAGGEFGRS
jgi:uncharacterized protein (UPF0332 family)